MKKHMKLKSKMRNRLKTLAKNVNNHGLIRSIFPEFSIDIKKKHAIVKE